MVHPTAIRARARSIAVAFALSALPTAPSFAVDAAAGDRLRHLVLHDCGSCHGMRLSGGLGPPLTPNALRDVPADSVKTTILLGRPGTAMPAWSSLLSDDEAGWIAQALKRGLDNAR